MKRSRALHHVESVSAACAHALGLSSSIVQLRVVRAHLVGPLLDGAEEVEVVPVALSVELPPDEIPWLVPPRGAQQWTSAARLRAPVAVHWRSAHGPVANHALERPLLVWDAEHGQYDPALAALRAGEVEALREPPPAPAELLAQLRAERDASLAELRRATEHYAERRWAPGTVIPLADALRAAGEGYLDLVAAVEARRTDDRDGAAR